MFHQIKNTITDVKIVMEGMYRMLDIVEIHMRKLDVNFNIAFTKYLRKRKENINYETRKVQGKYPEIQLVVQIAVKNMMKINDQEVIR